MFMRSHVSATSPEQIRAAYDALHRRPWLPPRASLFAWLVRRLEAQPGQSLLDVACGNAGLAQAARQAGLVYYGVDLSPIAVKVACLPGVLTGDGTRLPFADGRFDYVTSIGSLEHYLDMALGVRELARVLKPEGQACVLLPNAFGLTWNVLRVWRSGDLADDDGQPIQRFGTRGAWQRLLEGNGLQVRRALGYERVWPSTRAEWRAYLARPRELALALLAPLLPLDMRRCFVFLCAKMARPMV
jgi:SAM-dependent methyltransferase